jgi:leader peptidase (prepilin peptidase)/N-methyltransferase
MEVIITFVFALFGLVVGSFLNVCIDRLPADKSIVYPPSQCDSCRQRLAVIDLIPVFSYLFLRGRCRYCGSKVPWRLLWVELATGLIFAFSYWFFGLSWQLAVTVFYVCLFLVLFVIDLEHGLILNKIVYPMMGVALIIDIVWGKVGLVKGLIGGAAGFVFLMIPVLVYPQGMGWGDIKMAALIGLVSGFPLVAVALLLGVIGGGLLAGLLLLLGIKKRKDAIPFGPFLSLATVVTLYWGNDILTWYLGFF